MLYQLSRKTYSNLFSANKGYFIGKWLEFTNRKIEQRFIKGNIISNIQSSFKLHLIQLILSVLDCFIEKEYPLATYLHIVLSISFLFWIKKSQSVRELQFLSFVLQLYFFLRFAQFDLPYEFFILYLSVWGIFNVIAFKIMSLAFTFVFFALSQILDRNHSLLWPMLNGQRGIYKASFNITNNYTLTICEIEVEYALLSSLIYYYLLWNLRQNWKALDQAKRSERAYVSLFQQNTTPTFIVNHQGNMLELNETGKTVVGERRVSYSNCSFFQLIQNKQELEHLKQAFEQVTLTKETISIRANVTSISSSQEKRKSISSPGSGLTASSNDDQAKEGKASGNTQKSMMNGGGIGDSTISNSNTRNGANRKSNESSVAPSPQMPSLNSKKQSLAASPPVRHQVQIAPPLSKNMALQKIPYPFLPEQFDDDMKDQYLSITENETASKYYLVNITPFIWKETTAFLINLVDISETQDFVKISNFFMNNLNERLVSVLSHTEEDYQKWGNLAQLSQIKQTDLRELSAIISEQHSILSLTTLLRYLNQMYIGYEKGKVVDFQIINLIIQTIEVHSVRAQNYLKKIDLVFESFPPQVNGDAAAFYFIIHNLLYLMTYNCEYNDVDLSLNCTFLNVDRSSSLVLSFDFEFTATQDQIEFFQRVTKNFEDYHRCLVQSDLKGHDILETLYLMILNTIKLNDGSIHIEIVDPSKKNESNNQNMPVSQSNIGAPQSQQLIKQEPQPIKEPEEHKDSSDSQLKKLKVVLEYGFSTAEMHTIIKKQGDSSVMDSPAVTPQVDKKGTTRKHHALSKPPQINLSYTRFKEKQKDRYQWKQCNEEEKKQVAQIGLPRKQNDYQKQLRRMQNFGLDSDENIPNPIQRDISPLTVKPNMRKASTHTLNVGGGGSGMTPAPQAQAGGDDQKQNNNQGNQPPPLQTHSGSNILIQSNSINVKETSLSNSQIPIPQQGSSGNINVKKNLENISESAENIDRLVTSRQHQQKQQKNESDSNDINSDINDFFSDDNNLQNHSHLKKEIKTYLKLYNSNLIKDLSKIVKNVLSSSKVSEEFDLRFIDKSADALSSVSHNIAQFCSPQLPSSKLRHDNRFKPSPLVHSAFAGYLNPDASKKNNNALQTPNINSRRDSTHTEETPKSVVVSARPSKTSFPSMIMNSPLVVNNFRFRGESKGQVDSSKEYNNHNRSYVKQETKQWNELIPFEVHQQRLKRHVRRWILQDIWNKIYKKTDTVLVVSADFGDQSVMQQVFNQKKDLGRELEFSKLNTGFEMYMHYLKEAQVYKYILLDLRLDLEQIDIIIQQVRQQESLSHQIPRAFFVGFNSYEHAQYKFSLDFTIVGKVEVIKLLPFIKILKERK